MQSQAKVLWEICKLLLICRISIDLIHFHKDANMKTDKISLQMLVPSTCQVLKKVRDVLLFTERCLLLLQTARDKGESDGNSLLLLLLC